MRVAESAKLVYLNPPRTATTTIEAQLKANGLELWQPKLYSGHQTLWKPEWDDFFVFLSVRSPWTRAVSLWRRTVEALQYRTPEEREILKQGKLSFEGHLFSEYYEEWWTHVVADRFTWDAPRVDLVVHQETLEKDFNQIPGIRWIPRKKLNMSRDQSPWYAHYTSRCVDRVREVFAQDFSEYGYNPNYWEAKNGEFFA